MEEKFGIFTKKCMLKELKDSLSSYSNIIVTNYKGLRSREIEKLRKQMSKSSSRYLVVKNSIAKRALDELDIKELNEFIKGEVGISLASDIVAASKTLVDFSKEHSVFKLSCAYIDGKLEPIDRIKQLAVLPPRETLLAILLSYMKSPITGFVGVLNSLMRNFIYAINEIRNVKAQKAEKVDDDTAKTQN